MAELLRTTDIVFISYIESLLSGIGVESSVFDAGMSAMEGGINAFPRRVMVPEEDLERSKRILREEGHGAFLS